MAHPHQGSSASYGHYYAYVRDKHGVWAKCNDGKCAEVPTAEALREAEGDSAAKACGYVIVYVPWRNATPQKRRRFAPNGWPSQGGWRGWLALTSQVCA